MRAVQLQPIHASDVCAACAAHKSGGDAVHVDAGHGLGKLILLTVSDSAGRQQGPVTACQRLVGGFPAHLCGTFGAAVAQLQAEFGAAAGLEKLGDATQGRLLRVGFQHRAAWCDAALRRGRGHLDHHQGRAAQRPSAQMHQMKILHHAIHSAVSGHGADDDAVFELHIAYSERREHWQHRMLGLQFFRKPAFIAQQPAAIACAKVVMADALAAREQAVVELLNLHAGIALYVFKPFC